MVYPGSMSDGGRRLLSPLTDHGRPGNLAEYAALSPTGHLEADLQRVAEQYHHLARRHRKLILRLLPEVAYHAALHKASAPLRQKLLRSLFLHYQAAGHFPGRTPEDLMAAFMGPMAGKILLLGEVFDVETGFDAAQHVQGFLYGVAHPGTPPAS